MSENLCNFAPQNKQIKPMSLSDEHWWGFAAMPDGIAYPYRGEDNPMTLIAQLHLGEGLLYVFADLDYWFGIAEAESGPIGEWPATFFSVRYAPTRNDLHEHEIRHENGTSAVPAAEPLAAPTSRGEESYVLHAPTLWQDELAQDYPGYQVLLQLDESDHHGLRFYDCGTLFFLIRPEDLKAHRFDRVRCVLYSY